MMRRLLIGALLVSGLGAGIGPSAAACEALASTGTANAGYATYPSVAGEVQVSIWEDTLTVACADGSTSDTVAARLLIQLDGVARCDRTDVDPSYDPFLFGSGIHNDLSDACGADVTMASITDPLVPSVENVSEDSVTIGLERQNFSDAASVWFDGQTLSGLQSSSARTFRGITLSR
jgi:hypothetical protein